MPIVLSNLKNEKFQILCIGDKITSEKMVESLNNDTEPNEQINELDVIYSLSSVRIFQKCILNADVLACLVALGPDCINLTECQVGNIVPNFGLLNPKKAQVAKTNWPDAMKELRNNCVATYSAYKPNILLGYNLTEGNAQIGNHFR